MSNKDQMYADVIVDISVNKLDRSFQYKVPKELADKVCEGLKVRVPFGKGSRLTDGYILALGNVPKCDESKIKDIESLPDNSVTAEEKLMQLAAWIRNTYGSTFIQALKTVLPVREKKREKTERILKSAVAADKLKELYEECEKKHFKARARLLRELTGSGEVVWSRAVGELKVTASVIKKLSEDNIIKIEEQKIKNVPEEKVSPIQKAEPLNPEQARAFEGIKAELSDKKRPCLIRGVTGSGKTHIYLKLIEEVIEEGRQAILLIPEISLTWQTVSRFYRHFGERTAVLHSRLSAGERSELIERINNNEVSLVIGPRSALFVPFERLGMIIIDEEHDSSYQSEKTPRYHVREAAEKRAEIENAALILGSATPSLEARYRAELGEYALFELEGRYAGAKLPAVSIVDMREELKAGCRSIISRRLYEEINARLERKEQTMLFLNKRGHTGFYTCRSCGNVIKCPHCDVALTYHNTGKLMCHYCGYSRPMMELCPVCGSPYIGGFKVGTQQAEEVIKRTFPNARTIRMDRDTTSRKDSYEEILKGFADGQADIMIGTQMIVKGHDFPKVTLVGILAADSSLYAGDFRAAERTYQLIVQAVGRAGRGAQGGYGIIQTYNPDHYAITSAAQQDYEAFYQEEIENRILMRYPPVRQMMSIHGMAADENELLNAMKHIKNYIDRIKPENTVILGPNAEMVAKIQDMYRMVIYLKNTGLAEMIKIRQYTEKYIAINSGFDKINIQFAMND